jgi:hypothetical protein
LGGRSVQGPGLQCSDRGSDGFIATVAMLPRYTIFVAASVLHRKEEVGGVEVRFGDALQDQDVLARSDDRIAVLEFDVILH